MIVFFLVSIDTCTNAFARIKSLSNDCASVAEVFASTISILFTPIILFGEDACNRKTAGDICSNEILYFHSAFEVVLYVVPKTSTIAQEITFHCGSLIIHCTEIWLINS